MSKIKSIIKRVFEFSGSLKTHPDRLAGWTATFQTLAPDASWSEAGSFLLNVCNDDERAAVAFLANAIETEQDKALMSFVNSKAREEGKTYTRDEIKALPQRSEVVTKEELQEFADSWQIEPPKVKPESKVAAAEAARRRAEEEKEAATTALLEMLADLPKAKRQEKLDAWIAAGIVPEGTDLPG